MDERIRASRYNARYGEVKTVGVPRYLRVRGQRGSQKLITGWRCGNGEESNIYWGK